MEKYQEPTGNTLSGTVENIVYRNAGNDYTVLELICEDGTLQTAVGILPEVSEGEQLSLTGSWKMHAEYGAQFAFDSYERSLPTEIDDIIRFLSSKAMKGIGAVTALKLTNRFGTDTFEVIEQHPDWLTDIPGISPKRAAAIHEAFRAQSGLRELMMLCRNHIGTASVAAVYRKLGTAAAGSIRENPYRLCSGEFGIGFQKADALAASLGFSREDPARISAALRHVLLYNAETNGHTALPVQALVAASAQVLLVPEEVVGNRLPQEIADGTLARYDMNGIEYLLLPENDAEERFAAKKLLQLNANRFSFVGEDMQLLIERAEQECGLRYAPLQYEALQQALTGGVMILTGGPGTGKTTIVRGLVQICKAMGIAFALTAPTGRAAKRLSDSTDEEAKTVHRMLEMERTDDHTVRFNRNTEHPLEESVVIVDEASMLDLHLLYGLLRALRRDARLILIGDTGQLPSVGCGNVLQDLMQSGLFNTVVLEDIFRQASESLIVTNAHRIHRGEIPLLDVRNNDFFFLPTGSDAQTADTVSDLLAKRLPRSYGADVCERIQVITPTRKGVCGTEQLNRRLQQILNPPSAGKQELEFRGVVFREGDKVMQIRNNYELEWEKNGVSGTGVFNGDIGTLMRIDRQGEMLRVCFDDRITEYPRAQLEDLEHAWAVTVHKSQGSEYPIVVLPLCNCGPMLQTRNLLYTAVTRARQMVILVGKREVCTAMVENNRHVLRYTCLADRLSSGAVK